MNLRAQVGTSGITDNITITCGASEMELGAAFAGSYQILEMGQHFDVYSAFTNPILASSPGLFPTCVEPVHNKVMAPSVLGNLGEIAAAILAQGLGLPPFSLMRIKPTRGKANAKCPDFLCIMTERDILNLFAPSSALLTTAVRAAITSYFSGEPRYIPIEAKGCTRESSWINAQKRALNQLFSYWRMLPGTVGADVELGLISSIVFNPDPTVKAFELRVILIVTSTPAAFQSSLKTSSLDKQKAFLL